MYLQRTYSILDENVPRFVTASLNQDNPQRCINVKFDSATCEDTPLWYDIECRPVEGGPSRLVNKITQRDFTADHLMSDKEYRIYVKAVYSNGTSEGSMSNILKTKASE